MGRFGHIENLWAVLVGAVLVHGPFWYRPMTSRDHDRSGAWPDTLNISTAVQTTAVGQILCYMEFCVMSRSICLTCLYMSSVICDILLLFYADTSSFKNRSEKPRCGCWHSEAGEHCFVAVTLNKLICRFANIFYTCCDYAANPMSCKKDMSKLSLLVSR